MQQKIENDHRWHQKVRHARTDIGKIIGSRFFSQSEEFDMTNTTPMERLWYAMNQKFHKKQLWWEWRFQKLLQHVIRLQKTLTARNRIIQQQRDTLETQAEMIAKQDDVIKQLEAMLGVQNAIEERKGDHQQ